MNSAHQNPARRGLILLAVAAMLPLGKAQAQPQRQGLPAPQESILPSEPVDVPMHRFRRLPAIDATINGRGPFRLIVDTGAAGLILSRELADELKLPAPPGLPAGAAKVQLVSPGGPVSGSLAYVESLEVGGAVFRGIWTVGMDMPFGDGMDGVLGMNVFNECLLTYDYPRQRIRLSRGELPEANGRDILSFSTPGGSGSHPSIELMVDGKATSFMIDTGMRGWFAMPPEQVKKLGIVEGPVAGMRGLSAGGPLDRQIARLGTTLALGQYTVKNPLVSFLGGSGGVQLGSGRVLGTLLLEHFVVTFDARNNRVRLARESTAPIIPPSVRLLGIGLKRKGESMEVWAVHPDSHASSLGITEGSVVHEINGKPAVKFYGTSEWDELIRSADTVKLRYSLRGTEKARTVDVEILELLPGPSQHRGQDPSSDTPNG